MEVQLRSERAGLGSRGSVKMSLDNIHRKKRAEVWAKARERFEKLHEPAEGDPDTNIPTRQENTILVNITKSQQMPTMVQNSRTVAFVQGQSECLSPTASLLERTDLVSSVEESV